MPTVEDRQYNQPPPQPKRTSGCGIVLIFGIAVGGMFLLLCCGGSLFFSPESAGRRATDEELISRFHSRKAQFEELLSDPESPELMAALEIIKSSHDRNLRFVVWWENPVAPGWEQKGYVHCEEPPSPLVENTDYAREPNRSVYRHIEGKWHLYYEWIE